MIKINRIIRTRRRSIGLRIEPDGSLTVRAPLLTPDREIQRVVEQHAAWICKTQDKMKAKSQAQGPKAYAEGELFWFLGRQVPLHLVEGARQPLVLKENFLLDRRALANPAAVFENWYRAQAKVILSQRAAELGRQHLFQYRQVKITSARTRWGSCSSKGTLSFPWRLVMAPLEVIDYVVVHELVHTRIPNHGTRFWLQVAAIVPDYKVKRKWLEEHGQGLTL